MRSKVKKSDLDSFLQACNKDKFELSVDMYVVSLYVPKHHRYEKTRASTDTKCWKRNLWVCIESKLFKDPRKSERSHHGMFGDDTMILTRYIGSWTTKRSFRLVLFSRAARRKR